MRKLVRATALTTSFAAVLTVALGFGATTPATAAVGSKFSDLSARDDYQAAVNVSRSAFARGASLVYVVALSDVGQMPSLGSLPRGAMLFVPKGRTHAATAAEIRRLRPKRIVAIGTTKAIPETVMKSFRTPYIRLTGKNVYANSAAITRFTAPRTIGTVNLVNAGHTQNALSASNILGGVVLPVPANGAIPAEIGAEIKRLKPKKITVVGSPNAVHNAVFTNVKKITKAPASRLNGASIYDVSPAAVLASGRKGAVGSVVLSSGSAKDLAAATASRAAGRLVMFVDPRTPNAAAKKALTKINATGVTVIGKTPISAAVASAAVGRRLGTTPTPPVAPPPVVTPPPAVDQPWTPQPVDPVPVDTPPTYTPPPVSIPPTQPPAPETPYTPPVHPSPQPPVLPAPTVSACQKAIGDPSLLFGLTGYSLTCVSSINDDPDIKGATWPDFKRIAIRDDLNEQEVKFTVVHEVAHALSWTDSYLSWDGRNWFAQEANRQYNGGTLTAELPYAWMYGSTYLNDPNEIWANTFGKCHGYPLPDLSERRSLTCDTLERARTATLDDVVLPGEPEWIAAGLS